MSMFKRGESPRLLWSLALLTGVGLMAAGLTSTALSQDTRYWNPEENEYVEPSDVEYEPGEGYHEEEWYDPSDWFDADRGVEYEYDDYNYGDYGYNYYGDEPYETNYLDENYDGGYYTPYGYYTDDWYEDEGAYEEWYE